MAPGRMFKWWCRSGVALLALTIFPAVADAPGDAVDARAYSNPLAGSTWRLVAIHSMDDSVFQPRDQALYTLSLRADGTAILRADCNRGRGDWRSDGPGHIAFGPIAATRALCPSPSLSGRYLAQFEWVRSYVVQDGRLYLATMADGAIIEFEPGKPGASPEQE